MQEQEEIGLETRLLSENKVVIIGAGPAGLAAGLELSKNNVKTETIERNGQAGGLSRTIKYKGNYFDIGPHRFYTKIEEVEKLWHDLLKEDFIKVPRLTRILYNNKLFNYPLKPFNVLAGLGIKSTVIVIFNFILTKLKSAGIEPETFEEAISRQFGRKLFEIFFKTYTEKIWGIPCSKMSAEWATQRIKGLSLGEIIRNALLGERKGARRLKSLVEEFDFPVLGAGMMYEAMRKVIESCGGLFHMESEVFELIRDRNRIVKVIYKNSRGIFEGKGEYYISSIPLTELIKKLNPAPPPKILEAAKKLYFRNHVSVNLIIEGENPFPDNWIYVHAPEVKMARIANYGNFSPGMVADRHISIVTVEYFCFADDLYTKSDAEFLILAKEEMEAVGLLDKRKVTDGFVLRETHSYPVYYHGYKDCLEPLKEYISTFKNLQSIGRGGMYKYNNQDHSVVTGLYAARNLLGGNYDIWKVNTEGEYLEIKNNDKNVTREF